MRAAAYDNVYCLNNAEVAGYVIGPSFSEKSWTMQVKLLTALTLTLTCALSFHCVDGRSLRKSSPPSDDVRSRDTREVRGRYGEPVALGVPVMLSRGGASASSSRPVAGDASSLLNADERSQLASLLADVDLLEHLQRQRRPPTAHHLRELWAAPYDQLDDENLVKKLEEASSLVYGIADGGLAERRAGIPIKRAIGHLRSPRELHPVYLGLGQNAASAALNTYASLLADEKRRESLEQQQQNSANPVRFIGKR